MLAVADLEGLLLAALESMQDEGGHGNGRLHASQGSLVFLMLREEEGLEFGREALLILA